MSGSEQFIRTVKTILPVWLFGDGLHVLTYTKLKRNIYAIYFGTFWSFTSTVQMSPVHVLYIKVTVIRRIQGVALISIVQGGCTYYHCTTVSYL